MVDSAPDQLKEQDIGRIAVVMENVDGALKNNEQEELRGKIRREVGANCHSEWSLKRRGSC